MHRPRYCFPLGPGSIRRSVVSPSKSCETIVQTSTPTPPDLFWMKSLLDYGEEDEAYLYLDPKLRERANPAAARSRGPPREVIVFMIGGGCYSEYQNLQVRRGQSWCGKKLLGFIGWCARCTQSQTAVVVLRRRFSMPSYGWEVAVVAFRYTAVTHSCCNVLTCSPQKLSGFLPQAAGTPGISLPQSNPLFLPSLLYARFVSRRISPREDHRVLL